MALVLEVQKLEGLKNESAEWQCRFKFREARKETKPATGKSEVHFGDVRYALLYCHAKSAPIYYTTSTVHPYVLHSRVYHTNIPGSTLLYADLRCSC